MSGEGRGERVADYEYVLPDERIARYPTEPRDASRLMLLGRGGAAPPTHGTFHDLPELFEAGDVLVVNESRVFPARLRGRKPSGAAAEILLLRPLPDDAPVGASRWEALVRPGGKLKPGRSVEVGPELSVRIEDSTPEGGRIVALETALPVEEALARYGSMPLPPYLDREEEALDRERYQTVYAKVSGSVAAPTAGLHFTEALLGRIRERGVEVRPLVLHVGVGTFRPVEADDPAEHVMHGEWFSIPEETATAVNEAKGKGRSVWAVGTTVVRALESAGRDPGDGPARPPGHTPLRAVPGLRETRLFIRPPFEFRIVDAMVTNFHLPRSTLLMLVAAFAGYERTLAAYRTAIREGYRFYSYGDAMVIR